MSESVVSIRSHEEPALVQAHVARARELAPMLDVAAEQIESERELPARVLEAMHSRGLFRLSLPRFLDGAALQPALLAQVTETVAMADASTAWCLGQALGCAMSAAFLDEKYAKQVFGPRNAVLAWGAGAQGKAAATM